MPEFELSYELSGAGWATATFQLGSSYKVAVSYLHDSLLDLCQVAIGLRAGANRASALFMDEPGEHHLVFFMENEELNYELRWYKDWYSWDIVSENDFEIVTSGITSSDAVVSQVTEALDLIYHKYGETGYKNKWVEHPFPTREYLELKNA